MSQTSFTGLGIIEPIAKVLAKNNYTDPTPIQNSAIPILLEGHDLLGIAQTGTGKTAAFALPLLQRINANPIKPIPKTTRALVLAPTRELAIQIADNCQIYGENLNIRIATIFGGVNQGPQVKAMSRGVDMLIATPGRLLDLMQQGFIDLKTVEYLVLDEADRMLDMGFIKDIQKIIAVLPKKRQTLLFSATMPASISGLAASILTNPKKVEITPKTVAVERIAQEVYLIKKSDKRALLITLLKNPNMDKTIVFSKTKHGANRIVKELDHAQITSAAIHGNKSQPARQKALETFRSGNIRVLVATDIAARGIDVDNISHVINYDLPDEPESYVHRIGRTARAGAGGSAIAFCDEEDRTNLRDIERLINRKLPVTPTPILEKMQAIAEPERGRRSTPRSNNGRGARKPSGEKRHFSGNAKPAGSRPAKPAAGAQGKRGRG